MLLICVILIMVALFSSDVSVIRRGKDDFSYFDRERTSFINGSLILLIMLWHMSQRLTTPGFVDGMMSHYFFPGISQCVTVAPFLFFSGIGVYTSFFHKGIPYLGMLVHHRVPQLWLRFAVVVFLSCLCSMSLGHATSWQDLFLALLAWKFYGIINWYIFVIISSYLLFALLFRIFTPGRAIIWLTLSVFLMLVLLKWSGKAGYWYMTPLSFPAGVFFAWKKVQLHALILQVRHKIIAGCVICVLSVPAFHIPECIPYSRIVTANLASVTFCWGVLLISAALRIGKPCPFLVWCGGRAVLALLLFHMLPVWSLRTVPFFVEHDSIYIMGCILLSFIGACMTLFVWEHTVDRLFVSRK